MTKKQRESLEADRANKRLAEEFLANPALVEGSLARQWARQVLGRPLVEEKQEGKQEGKGDDRRI